MKIADVIEKVDRLTNNLYTTEQKVKWLQDEDCRIYLDAIVTHINPEGIQAPNYSESNLDEELIIKDPYAEDFYINYLQMKIAKENGEDAKQNKAIAMANEAYLRWARYHNETHQPLPKKPFFRF